MKLPPTEALILNQGMPAYIAKKCVYYEDKRFMKNAYSRRTQKTYRFLGFRVKSETASFLEKTFLARFVTMKSKEIITGFKPPATRKELEDEAAGLPSQIEKRSKKNINPEQSLDEDAIPESLESFDPLQYIEEYGSEEDFLPASCAAFDPEQENEAADDTGEEDDIPKTIYETFSIDSSYFAEPGRKETVRA
jgi:hypothetical protein